jgi:hypothetical protein
MDSGSLIPTLPASVTEPLGLPLANLSRLGERVAVEGKQWYTHSYLALPGCWDRASPLPAGKFAPPWRAGSRRGETVVHSFLPNTPRLLGQSLSATRWQI